VEHLRTWREELGTWRKLLVQTYLYGPTTALAIAGLIAAIFGALFARDPGWQALLVNIGTALLLIPPIVVTERLVLSGEVEEVREAVDKQLAELRKVSTQHDHTREDLPPSAERTRTFSQIFEKVKEQVKYTDINAKEARDLFKLPYGDRLIVLASASLKQDPKLFPQVIEAIEHSITAFEQARALDAAEEMLPNLSEAQKKQLVKVINENPWIREGTYRWIVRGRILKELGH
jgi:hypothetical protein